MNRDSRFKKGDIVIYKPFLDGINYNTKELISNRECEGVVDIVKENQCLGFYYTYKIILNDCFVIENAREYDLAFYK